MLPNFVTFSNAINPAYGKIEIPPKFEKFQTIFHNNQGEIKCLTCDNVINGGGITGDETGCGIPFWDPGLISNVTLPTGGSGALEYMWMYTTDDPSKPIIQWSAIPNSNTPELDPTPISQTTYYTRCSRRAGCSLFTGETPYITKKLECCDNLTNPGTIGTEQNSCSTPFDPNVLTSLSDPTGGSGSIIYVWKYSFVGGPINDIDWVEIPNSNFNQYDPPITSTTIFYARCAKRDGCPIFINSNIIKISIFPTVLISNINVIDVLCNGSKTGSILLNVSGGTTPYSFNWSNGLPSTQNQSDLGAGTYSVTVTDAKGCTKTATATITEPNVITLSTTVVNVKCNGGKDGSINLSVTGGTAPYTYNWDNAPDVEDPSGLGAGTYNVTVTDANGCTKATSATITEPTLIALSTTIVNVKCNGGSDGSINLSITGGTAPYTFNWDNAPDVEDPSGLAAGTYNVTVTDANGCTKTATATITEPTAIALSTTVVNLKCNGGSDGSINLSITGGTAPYTFNWDNAPDVEDPSGLAAGTYNVTVTDANGCTKTATATITEPAAIALSTTVVNVKCNGGTDGSINLTVTGGTAPYTYNWDNAPDVEDPSGLAAGTYNVTVTDANGCTKTATATITEPAAIALSTTVVNVKCNGGTDGSINLTVTGGTAPYTYNWDNAPDVEDPSGLAAGTYNVTVTDANGCTKTATATITEPAAIALSTTVVNVKCNGGTDGLINLTVTGGTAPYTYNWDNAPDVEDPSGLGAGTYNVIVTDANGCTKTATATITEPAAIALSTTIVNVKCNGGSDGSINLSVTGGTAPYTYNWDNAPDIEDPFGLGAGTYNVTVTDANGCTKTATATITEPTAIALSTTAVNVKCNAGTDGSINLSVTGGTAPFTYNWDNAPDLEDPSGLGAGTYNVTVTDANGCSKTATATITEPAAIALSTTIVNVKCNGGSDGSINLTVTGGTAPFTYNWDNAPDVEDPSGIGAGTYNVIVTDANGCTKTATAIITEPSAITLSTTVINVKCNGGSDGSINLTVTGGTAPYTYNWDYAPDLEDPSGLGAGTYNVTVTDANGCTKTATATITEPAAIALSTTVVNVKCNGGTDGSINLTVTGGTAPYTYNWDNAPDVEDPSGLAAGTYNVTVTDANGCTKTATATITEPAAIALSTTAVNVKCNAGTDGSINLSVTGGTAPFTYNWDNAPDLEDPSGLGAGTYIVTVTDANGCTKTATATITEPTAIALSTTVVNVKCNGGTDGLINLTVTGGTAPYTYNWDNAPDVEDPSGLGAGTYNLTVTDANGCTKTATATITEPTAIALSTTAVNVKCNGGTDGSINLTVTGGTAPYTYNWDNAPDVEDPPGLSAGTYNVTVTDANGCTKTATETITEPTAIALSTTVVNVKCNGGTDGSINLTVIGGTAPFTYNWDNAPDVEDPSGLSAGTYNVKVTDSNGCTKTATAVIIENSTIALSTTVVNVKCNGGTDGSINLTVTGGTAPYTYNWDNAPDVEDPSGLGAGTYNVTVTDANSCTKTTTATIIEPTAIALSTTAVNVKCNAGTDGSINLSVTGGTAPYTYNWDNAPDVEDPSGLGAGTYNVTVTDANGCTKTATETITEPTAIALSTTVVNVKCNGGSDGSIYLSITGGTAPYTYNWDNAPDVEDPSGLGAGTYNVTVTDANSCTKTTTATIIEPTAIALSTTAVNVKCNAGTDGSINLSVTGGTAPFTYNWDNAPDVEDPSGLAAGTYNVTVTDANGCTKTATATITEQSAITLSTTIVNVKCNGGSDGSINLTVTGGTAPFTYNWDNAPDVEDPSGIGAGTYNVIVTDANGCTKTATAIITEPSAITLSTTVVNVKCNGGTDGSINLSITGGTAPYTYNWDNAPDVEDPSGLGAGTYNVTVTDANSCTKTTTATIIEPTAIALSTTAVNVKCNAGTDGSINLSVTGGTAPFTYNWDNAPDVEDPSGLGAGTYIVTVTDANGCTKTATATITEPTAIALSTTVVNVKCNGGTDGSINLSITGGTAPFTYNWDNAPDVEDPSGIGAGTYNVIVTDANGCTKTATAIITEPSAITLSTTVVNVKCNGGKDGSINLNVTGGTAPFTYNWDNAPDVEDPSGLGAGTYIVTVTDANGCTKTATATITEQSAITLSTTVVNVKCNGGTDGSINLSITGGTAPYTYNWDNAPDVEDPSGLAAGTYNVTVTDANGCTKTATATITEPDILNLTTIIKNVTCNGGNDGSINLTVYGGTAPYSFNWDNAPDVEDPSGLAAGAYTVIVSDKNDCFIKFTFNISQPNQILISSSVTPPSCINVKNGKINTTVSGGTPPYTFNWDNAPDVQNPDGLFNGTYNLTVTDAKSCTAIHTVQINGTLSDCVNIGDFVWLDSDKDGIQGYSEKGINGIKISLIDVGPDMLLGTVDDKMVEMQTTKTKGLNMGYYLFENVPPGKYAIMFMPDLSIYKFSKSNVGFNDLVDSDADEITGKTAVFMVISGQADDLSFDAGLHLICDNITNGGTIGYDEILCAPGQVASTMVNIVSASGGIGNLEYVWMYSLKNSQFSPTNPDWYAVPNSNFESYSPGKLYETTYFVRCVRREGCTNYAGESNMLVKTVLQSPIVAKIKEKPLGSICKNQTAYFSALDNNPPGTLYSWYFGVGANPTNALGANASTKWETSGSKVVTLTVSLNGFCSTYDLAVVDVGTCFSNKTKIVYFNAVTNDGITSDLSWQTEKINTNHSFNLEKSFDGVHFEKFVEIDGKLDYSLQYNNNDNAHNNGVVFYRVRLIFQDGHEEISDLKMLTFYDQVSSKFKVYPIPTDKLLFIESINPISEKLYFSITDLLGRNVLNQDCNDSNTIPALNLQNLTNGFYILKIMNTNKQLLFNTTILKQ